MTERLRQQPLKQDLSGMRGWVDRVFHGGAGQLAIDQANATISELNLQLRIADQIQEIEHDLQSTYEFIRADPGNCLKFQYTYPGLGEHSVKKHMEYLRLTCPDVPEDIAIEVVGGFHKATKAAHAQYFRSHPWKRCECSDDEESVSGGGRRSLLSGGRSAASARSSFGSSMQRMNIIRPKT